MKSIIDSILRKEVQDFIHAHEHDDVQKLLLKQKTLFGVPTEWIANQISGRRKSQTRLSDWYKTGGIIYPHILNLEQSSSQATAQFKRNLVQETLGIPRAISSGCDLTGGFGIDGYYLSLCAKRLDYIETNEALTEIAKHNHNMLGAKNIQYHNTMAELFLSDVAEKFDFLFLDPSRRKAHQKIYKLSDSSPDIVSLLPQLLVKAEVVLLKTSPLFDIQQGCRELKNVNEVVVVAVENECKELLFLLKKDFSVAPVIRAVDLRKNGEINNSVSFRFEDEKSAIADFGSPLTYLYEPNVAILKAGAFKWIARQYRLKKMAPSTHLYTSEKILDDFPGRIFKITDQVKPDKKLKDRFTNGYANIIARNYPLSVAEIKKKTGLKEGGDQYLIGTQTEKEKLLLMAERVK